MYELFTSGIFHLIISGCGWLRVTEISESETSDKVEYCQVRLDDSPRKVLLETSGEFQLLHSPDLWLQATKPLWASVSPSQQCRKIGAYSPKELRDTVRSCCLPRSRSSRPSWSLNWAFKRHFSSNKIKRRDSVWTVTFRSANFHPSHSKST